MACVILHGSWIRQAQTEIGIVIYSVPRVADIYHIYVSAVVLVSHNYLKHIHYITYKVAIIIIAVMVIMLMIN